MAGDQRNKQQEDTLAEADTDEATPEQPVAEQDAGQPVAEQDAEVTARIQEAVDAALAGQRDLLLRAQAEVQNMRRRCEADVEKAHKFALERFSAELLPVIDNLERALAAVPDAGSAQVKALCEGVELTLKGFLETLGKFGISQVNPAGEPFDPQLHQAITTVAKPEVQPNSVIEVMQKGYTLHGRVLRPAMVVVAKGP